MIDKNEFNIETADLSSNMILEASAGTGKTYSLEHLFIRYILELGISVKEILVVTFTEKAASELKKRIKTLLREKLLNAESESLLDKSHILKNALYDFSEAGIFTIHGFCQNCLSGFPVESGLPFDFKIIESGNIYEETVLDYFRTLDIEGDDEYLSFRSGKSSFDECCKYFVNLLKKDSLSEGLSIYPDDKDIIQYENLKNDFITKTGKLYDTLQLLKEFNPDEELISSINNKLKLRINSNFRPLLIELFHKLVNAETLSDFFSKDLLYHYGRIIKLTLSWLDNNEKDISLLDENEYEFVLILDSIFLLSDGYCFDEVNGKFPYHDIAGAVFIIRSMKILSEKLYLKKMKNSKLDFSDLIKLTRDAVMNSSDNRGKEFKEEIRRKYKIVLIDEFQDTDNIQWEIFSSIFYVHNRRIILIGDPKQSIYRFRGADIEVYFKALNEIKGNSICYMLETNYRSEKRVVNALNILFEKVFAQSSGGGHSIDFTAVKSIEEKDKLLEKGGVEFLAVDNDEKYKAEELTSTLEKLFAAEIKNLLESVPASDICILLESNEKCRNMYENLVSLNIPAVYEGDIDLFKSDEIYTAIDFLSAVSYPLDRGKIIKSLISPLFDFQLSDLPALDDDFSFEKLSSCFYRWKEMADRGDLSAVLDEVFGSEKLFPQLSEDRKSPYLIRKIAEIGGERKITNFDHIGEILIKRNRSKRDNSLELLTYLISVMEGAENEDEKLTRLERDDKSVRIMTIHKSKGLEFPIVFFGGGFTGESLPKSNENYYEYVDKGKRYIDLVKKGKNKIRHYYEQWEEKKRLYYVAFTRAEQKLYLPLFKHTNLNYITDIYGSMVYDSLVSSLKLNGISPKIPFAGMALPGKMKKDELSDIVSEKIYQLILENYNDCELFTVNTELYSSILENGLEPLSKIVNKNTTVGSEDFSLVFKNASGNYRNKNISLFSYSSLVRADRYHYSIKPMLLGENSPGDDELVPSSGVTVSQGASIVLDASGTFEKSNGDETTGNTASVKDKKYILKGPLFGNLMHTLLEKADYQKILKYNDVESMSKDEEIQTFLEKISKQFLPHDKIKSSLPDIRIMLFKTIHGNFSIPGEYNPLCIGQIDEKSRRHELEFLLKINEGRGSRLLNLPFLHLDNGYIKGFIDLIFLHDNLYYIADWKTNYLGNELDDYQGENLETAMTEHNYYLQMKLYMTALARIISVREGIALNTAVEKIGGCYYFFLRGLDNKEKDSGVYFSPPELSEILRFSDTFFEDVR